MIIFLITLMGVKNLNILINLFKNNYKDVPREMYSAVVDGNNMLITFLQSAVSNLSFGMNIVEQTNYIISTVYERVIKEFDKFVKTFHLHEIWLVFDPRKKFEYNIDRKLFNLIDYDYFDNKYKGETFTLSSKDNEHNKRERGRMYSEKTFDNDNDKELYGYRNQRIANKLVKIIQKLLIDVSRFTNGCDYLNEEHNILTSKYKMTEKYKLYIVQGEHTEADLIIKNLVEMFNTLHSNYNFLVVSKDTDYKILFANRPNVWCSDLNCNRLNVVSPYIMWCNFFKPLTDYKDIDIYKAVIRLAPLIGNDYTAGCSSIITIRNDKEINLPILRLFNKNIITSINMRTNLGKFLSKFNYDKTLDENVKVYDKSLYDAYIESVVIYENWLMFGNDYYVNTKQMDLDENLKLVYNIILKNEFNNLSAKDENDFINMFHEINNKSINEFDEYLDILDSSSDETNNQQSTQTNNQSVNKSCVDDIDEYINLLDNSGNEISITYE